MYSARDLYFSLNDILLLACLLLLAIGIMVPGENAIKNGFDFMIRTHDTPIKI